MVVNQDSVTTDIWKLIYDTIKNNVISVNITGLNGVTIQNYVAAYPESMLDEKSNYPIMIINSPEFSYEPVTYRNEETVGSVEIEIMTNQSESADRFKDLICKTMRDNEEYFRTQNLDEVELQDTSSTHYERGKIKVHSRKLVWGFRFYA